MLSAKTQQLEEVNRKLAAKLANTKVKSLQQRLAARTFNIAWFGIILPVIAPLLYFELEMPWWVAIFYGAFGIAMSCLAFSFGLFVKNCRLTELPVAEAINMAYRIRNRQQINLYCGILFGVILIVTMGCAVPEGPERTTIFIGGGIGLAIGLAFSVNRCIVNARLARELIDSLDPDK